MRTLIHDFLAPYQRARPDLALKFVDPREQPKQTAAANVRSSDELVIEYAGRTEHLASLTEQEMANLLMRLLRNKERVVMSLDGHVEPTLTGQRNFDLGEFGQQLQSKGFRVQALNLAVAQAVPDNCSVLVIPQPRTTLLKGEVDKIERYLERGGNLLWLVDEGPLRGLERIVLFDPLRTIGTGILAAIPNLIFLAVVVVVVRFVLKALHLLFSGLAEGTVTLAAFEREWSWPTYRLVRLLVLAFSVVVAYPYIPGSGSDAFKGVSLFLGVIFSLGSSSVISNVIAGYTMTYRRAFRIGDRVRINEHLGDVAEMRLLVTHLRSPKNEEIVIPNSLILNSSVVNYSSLAREGKLILNTTVGIGYETPWRQVETMLLQAAERTEGLLREPGAVRRCPMIQHPQRLVP